MARIHTRPGEVLREEFMKPLGLSANALALALRVPATRISAVLHAYKPRPVSAQRCAWAATSARQPNSGSTCNPPATCRWRSPSSREVRPQRDELAA